MKCPECVSEGEQSRVMVGGQSTTLMAYQDYYDEDGRYHHHDGNTTTTAHSCSRGHRWNEVRKSSCPTCDKAAVS